MRSRTSSARLLCFGLAAVLAAAGCGAHPRRVAQAPVVDIATPSLAPTHSPKPLPTVTVAPTTEAPAPVDTGAAPVATQGPAQPPAQPYGQVPPPAGGQQPVGWHPVVTDGKGGLLVESESVAATGMPGRVVVVLRFSMNRLKLVLHAGSQDPGGSGWAAGPAITGPERDAVVAAFNGGFSLSEGRGGYEQEGKIVRALQSDRGSAVMYADGHAAVGKWGRDVGPAGNVVSVRQNVDLLVDNGVVPPTVDGNAEPQWGYPLNHSQYVSRSSLGMDGAGRLLFAAAARTTVRAIADAQASAGARQAMELDINPEWVCAFGFTHPPSGISVQPLLPEQQRPAGTYLSPYSRDFFTLVLR